MLLEFCLTYLTAAIVSLKTVILLKIKYLLFWKISMKKNIIVSTFLFTAKMRRRGNISLKLVAQMLTKAGFNHIITVDMHSKESQGFFDCAIDNLRASPFLIQYIQESVSK